jgi:hypothetical protein
LAEFARAVAQSELPSAAIFEAASFSAWPVALAAACQGATREVPVVLVLDEVRYLAEFDDLQSALDQVLERSPVLVACVDSDERSPLHGRPTLEMTLAPLTVAAAAEITGAGSSSDAIDRYLVAGGFPLLAARWPEGRSRREFLEQALVDDHAFVTTALRIMASEFASQLSARRVIEAIGQGESSRGRIETRAGVKGNTLDDALRTLTEAKGLVDRRAPYAAPAGTKFARYAIADPYLRFWLRFVGPYLAEISRGRGDLTLARIERDWTAYRGRAVEPLIRAALERLLLDPNLADRLGGAVFVGSYWTRDNSVEVDLVGADALAPSHVALVGSVKWHQSEPFTATERRALVEHRAQVPGAADARLVIASRTGTEPGVQADLIVGPDEIVAAWT